LNEGKKYVGSWYPEGLLRTFDETIKGMYANRTAALHEAMRDFIRKLEEEKRQRETYLHEGNKD